MIDEFKLRKDAERAREAKSLIENKLLTESFEALEREYIKALLATHVDAPQAREKLFLAVHAARKAREHLHTIISDGTLANRQLKELADMAERPKSWVDIRP